jgi:hypothetical protein
MVRPNLNKRQKNRTGEKIKAQDIKIRNKLWPDFDENSLWDNKKAVGFAVIPRTLPLIVSGDLNL